MRALATKPLFPKQAEILATIWNGLWKYYVCCCGRQFGKTDLSIELALLWLVRHDGCTVYYISQNFALSEKVFGFLRDRLNLVVYSSVKGHEIILQNGSKIYFMSYDKWDGLRGNNHATYILLDEAAKLPNIAWESVVKAMCLSARKVVMLSTPRGKNWFWEQYNYTITQPEYFKFLQATTFDNPFIPEWEKNIIRMHQGSALYQQEHMAQFIDSGGEVFTNIESLFVLPKFADYKKTVAAGDIARETDFNTQYILNEKKELVYHNAFAGLNYNYIDSEYERLIRKYKSEWLIEDNGIGSPVVERLEMFKDNSPRFSDYIERWTMNNSNKYKLVNEARLAIFNGEIKLLNLENKAMQKIKSELECYEYKLNVDGHSVSYGAPKGMNDDEVSGLCLVNRKWEKVFNRVELQFF